MTLLPKIVRIGADVPVQDGPTKGSNVGPVVMLLSLGVAVAMFVHVLSWKR